MVIFVVSIEKFFGKNVIGSGGIILGETKGAEVNPGSWQVTHLQVKLTSQTADQLGFKKRFGSQTVCMPVSIVSAVGDVITITSSLEDLKNNTQITACME
jgi:sporulation protein YlmC with PRC-barrel domain